MRTWKLILIVLSLCANIALAQTPKIEIPLPEKSGDGFIIEGEGAARVLKVEAGANVPDVVHLLDIEKPALTSPRYYVRGLVKYQGATGESYLELLNDFGNQQKFFTRTAAPTGPMGKITGDSDWREFVLPFSSEPGLMPAALILNLKRPDTGTVWIKGLQLIDAPFAKAAGAWWSDPVGGLMGGIYGGVVGLIGATIGILTSTGKARRLVQGILLAMGITGILLLASGLIALSLGQPYGVWYPMVLPGVLTSTLGFSLMPSVKKRFEQIELQRMKAVDAGSR